MTDHGRNFPFLLYPLFTLGLIQVLMCFIAISTGTYMYTGTSYRFNVYTYTSREAGPVAWTLGGRMEHGVSTSFSILVQRFDLPGQPISNFLWPLSWSVIANYALTLFFMGGRPDRVESIEGRSKRSTEIRTPASLPRPVHSRLRLKVVATGEHLQEQVEVPPVSSKIFNHHWTPTHLIL